MIDPDGVSAASPALTEDERGKVLALIERLVRECPERQPTSEGERRAQRIVQESFKALGLRTEFHPFEFNDNLYSNLALHFGLGTLGTAVSGIFPLAGLALHLAAGSSFFLDATLETRLGGPLS